MGDSERSTGIPNPPLETVDKSPSLMNDGRKAMERDVNGNATQVHKEQELKIDSKSTASEVHSSQKSTIENPFGTEDHSPRTSTTSTSALAMPSLASTDTGLISTASNNTVDCNDTHTNESISTPPDQQSRHSKKETILYSDSQETSQSQVVVTVPQQQTVYYQIPQLPSVVTLPVESSQDSVPKTNDEIDQPESIEQQQLSVAQSHLPIQTEDQIIGMVGAIPIIKMQGGGTHYVKEKKGRFNLLQTTPVIPSVVGVTSSTSSTSQIQPDESRNSTVAPTSNSSNSRSQSPAPAVACTPAAPQTFDGKSAPTVKRKGRFVVTNVKDPGSIIQIQTKSAPEVAVVASSENTVTSSQHEQIQQQQPQHQQQEQQVQTQPQPIQQQQSHVQVQQPIQQPVQNQVQPSNQQQQQMSPLQTPIQNPPVPIVEQAYQQPNVSQIPLQPVVIQPVSTIQQYQIPQQYQQIHTQHTVPATQQVSVQHYPQNLQHQTVQYASVHPQNQQQNYVQYVPQVQHTLYASNQPTHSTGQPISVAVPHGQQVVYNQQYPQQIPQQHYSPRTSYVQTQQIHPSPSFPVNQQPVSQTRHTATPPSTPGGSTSSPMQTRPAVTSTLPNAPIPKPTTTNVEKPPSTKSVAKKKTTGRSGKVPQSFDSNGTGSSIGFGRVFYLLDQMKTEVTDADQCIKTLQTDTKLLRDKNKDLEAKNKELDSKLREEQALREKAEIRNMDLRKKLREAKDEIKALKQANMKTTKDENESPRHSSTDAASEKVSNPNSGGKEAKTTITGSASQPIKTVSGASPKRSTTATDGTLKMGSSHSHSSISQLASTSPISKVSGMNGNSSLNIPKIDLNLKEQPELKNATKPRGAGKESELRRAVSMELSTGTKSAKEKTDVSHKRVESMHTLGTPPLVPPLRTNGTKSSGHKHTQSLHEFDPLKSTVPVLSFQTPLSFETTTTSESVPLPQYMSQSGVMMPVSFGMSPTAVRTTDGGFQRSPPPMTERQTLVANNYQGLHEQQFMVVPQQQPIVFNQMAYPTQQRPSAVQNHQYTNGSLQQQNGQHQPLRGHVQQPTHQHAAQQTYTTTASANPFHPLT